MCVCVCVLHQPFVTDRGLPVATVTSGSMKNAIDEIDKPKS